MNQPTPTLGELIAAHARRTPDALAVAQWDTRLSYRELVGRAGALAAELRSRGVGPEIRVGICARRSPSLVVAVLGVLLSGGCYVPLDPEHPQARRRDIARDAGARIVVGDGPGMIPIPVRGDDVPAPCPALPDHLAHVLYTSGSTGRPKGVLTTHRNIVEFVTSCAEFTGADADTRALGLASLGFDATSMDLFVPLSVGGSVALVGEADRADPARLLRFIAEHRVNWGFITPAVLDLLEPEALPDWRLIMCGGEVVPPALLRRWVRPGRRVFHVYGPTETTVLAAAVELTGGEREPLPLGRPLPDHRARIVDGELLIGGPGLARGYLNRPGLTAERFVPDPDATEPGARLYRTGDLARLGDDGQLEFLGRHDGQVKVRGQRIEVGEVEAVLREQPGVGQAVVEPIARATGVELVAFVTPANAPHDILAGAAARLTSAMLPSRVIRLDALPRNDSAKVDRARLRALAAEPGQRPVEPAPGSEPLAGVEVEVAGVWRRVLDLEPGRDTEFFASGGNSIAAMRLVAALRAELARDVAVEDVFAGRTLAGIAERVAKAGPLPDAELEFGNPPTLSSPQRRMWFADQLTPDEAPYNIALAQRLRGPLDAGALRAALTAVAARHDVLRWRILEAVGVPYPVCDPVLDVPLPVVDVGEGELRERLAAGAREVFDPAAAPPWRATLLRIGPDDHVLAITLHHAVFDGWSQRVLYADLAAAYAGRPLPRPAATYADYATWRERRDRRHGGADLAWWLAHLDGAPRVVDLPRDRPRPAVASYRGAQTTAAFPAAADAAVRRLAADLGTTPACVLLAGFGQLLHRVTGRAEHVIGAVVADRRLAEFDDLVGFFIDMVPVLLRSEDGRDFADHVRRCGAELLAATAHAGAPVERVVEGLGLARDPSRAPLVQVMFNFLNFAEPELELPGIRAETIAVDKPGSPLDLTIYVSEPDGGLALEALYNPDLFDGGRIARLLADYVTLVGALAAAPDDPVAAAPVLPAPGSPEPGLPAPDLPALAAGGAAAGGAAADGAGGAGAGWAAGGTAAALAGGAAGGSAETEELVAGVWREVLGLEAVGPTDNFFDVGGSSLALAEVRARLSGRLGRPLALVDLFRNPNVRSLAAFLDGAADNSELARVARRVAARRTDHRRRRQPGGEPEQRRSPGGEPEHGRSPSSGEAQYRRHPSDDAE